MLATLIIEFCLAIYAFVRYKMTRSARIIVILLIVLGSFQLSEYMICGGLGLNNIQWAKFGYAMTALLPALAIHLIVTVAEKRKPIIVGLAYFTALIFLAYFMFFDGAISGQQCYANYAVFYAHGIMSKLFGLFYLVWLTAACILALRFIKQVPKKSKTLKSILFGGAIFLIPTYVFNLIDPATVKAIPSVMCGFAVLFAIVLGLKTLPSIGIKRKIKK